MFSEYIEHCINNNEKFDDYTLSKKLGITQSRIRALKERKELKYPHENFVWKEEFVKSINNAKYDENDHYIKFIIEDINVMNEVRHYIEYKGWYDECSLNKKLLRIPMDCFTEICLDDESVSELFSEETKSSIRKIVKNDNCIKKLLEDFTKEGLKSFVMCAGKEAILSVFHCFNFNGIAERAFSSLERIIGSI